MADENVHVKLAMAEVLGLFLVSIMAITVGLYGLEVYDGLSVILGVASFVGLGLLLCTFIAFWNENVLVTAAFGIFAIFLLAFAAGATAWIGDVTGSVAGESMQIFTIFCGLGLLMVGWVSMAQPVKILPIFLFIAALAFIMLGLWIGENGPEEDFRMIVGVLWTIASLMALYMATAIAFLVVKGKPVLPLLIKA